MRKVKPYKDDQLKVHEMEQIAKEMSICHQHIQGTAEDFQTEYEIIKKDKSYDKEKTYYNVVDKKRVELMLRHLIIRYTDVFMLWREKDFMFFYAVLLEWLSVLPIEYDMSERISRVINDLRNDFKNHFS